MPTRPEHHKKIGLRKWLGLLLLALFLTPVMTMMVIGYIVFRDTEGPIDASDRIATLVRDHPDSWTDPTWQQTLSNELNDRNADVVLRVDGEQVFASSDQPLDASERTVRRETFSRNGLDYQADIYASPNAGPPEELRHAFVPIALILGLAVVIGGIAWFLRRSFIVPLTATRDAAQRLAEGDFTGGLPRSRVREIDDLVQSFDRMRGALQRSQAEQSRMEDDRRFLVSAVAHDLRTPLFSLRGSLEGLAGGVANTPEKRETYLRLAMAKANDLERLIADLFMFSRLEYLGEKPVFDRVDLVGLAHERADGLRVRAADRGIEVIVDAEEPVAHMSADDDMVRRALDNVLDNALRHAPDDSTIRIDINRTESHWTVSVSDEGPGVPEAEMSRIFDPLVRGESSRNRSTGGAGLGLSVVRRIMQVHGGSVNVVNNADHGATFQLRFPTGD